MAITGVINDSVLTDYLFAHCFKNCAGRTRDPYFCDQITTCNWIFIYSHIYIYLYFR